MYWLKYAKVEKVCKNIEKVKLKLKKVLSIHNFFKVCKCWKNMQNLKKCAKVEKCAKFEKMCKGWEKEGKSWKIV